MENVVKSGVEKVYKSPVKCYLPARFIVVFLAFWGMCIEYVHRFCLSVTIVVMVNHTASDQTNTSLEDDGSCPNTLGFNQTETEETGDYAWSPSTQGIILGAYYYGYVCTQIMGGRVAELAGGKWPFGFAILIGSFLTLITPLAADTGVIAIVLVRVLMGLFHGICLPTMFALFANWASIDEKSTFLAICFIGNHVGIEIAMPLSAFLVENGFAGGWPSVFYVFGISGCVWFVAWALLAHNAPSDHKRISKEELDYIQKGKMEMMKEQKLPVPWRKVLLSLPVWSTIILTFCVAWGQTTLHTKLPTYLELVLHVPIQKNGFINAMIYICSCVTMFLSGYGSDYLRLKKGFSATTVRKGFTMVAILGAAISTAIIPLVGCREELAIALLILSNASIGFTGGGHISIAADMAPHLSAILGAAISTAIIPLVGCREELAIALLILSNASIGFTGGGHISIAADMAPHLSAILGAAISTAIIPLVGCREELAIALLILSNASIGFTGGGHISIAADMAPHLSAILGAAISTAIIPLVGCREELAIALLILSNASIGFTGGGHISIAADMAPHLSAILGAAISTAIIPLVGCREELAIALLILSNASIGFTGGGHISIAADMAPHLSAILGAAISTAIIPLVGCREELAIALLILSNASIGFTGGGHISIAADMAPHLSAILGAAISTAIIPLVGCREELAIALLILSNASIGFTGGGHISIAADMAPHLSATVFGFINGIGCTSGIFAPLVAGLILDNAPASLDQWNTVFYLTAGLYLAGGLCFQLFASAERQPWAQVPSTAHLIYTKLENEPILARKDDPEIFFKYGSISSNQIK